MNGGRLGALAYGLRHLRAAPDVPALLAARSPQELARLVLMPAARNLGIAVAILPADLRAEATAAILACRVLDAYEDLMNRPMASGAVLTAVGYLNGTTDTPPPPLDAVGARDSETVDLLLAGRIRDVRELLSALPPDGRQRAGRMLVDVGRVMAQNLDSTLPRSAYSEGVLGRAVLYACSLVTDDDGIETELGELAGCIGTIAQLANDLRDGELELYGAGDLEELTTAVMLRLLIPALGGFALLAMIDARTASRGARAAVAYMAITTTAFLCAAVGAPAPYRQRLRLVAALLAGSSSSYWTTMLDRVRSSVDVAIDRTIDGSRGGAETGRDGRPGPALQVFGLRGTRSLPPSIGPLVVGNVFALVRALPDDPLTGELPDIQVRRMMIADHLAFGAVERLDPGDVEAMRTLAAQFQVTALENPDNIDTAPPGVRP